MKKHKKQTNKKNSWIYMTELCKASSELRMLEGRGQKKIRRAQSVVDFLLFYPPKGIKKGTSAVYFGLGLGLTCGQVSLFKA